MQHVDVLCHEDACPSPPASPRPDGAEPPPSIWPSPGQEGKWEGGEADESLAIEVRGRWSPSPIHV